MDVETAAKFSSYPSDIMVLKVYGEAETPYALYTPTSSSFVNPCVLDTRENSSRYHGIYAKKIPLFKHNSTAPNPCHIDLRPYFVNNYLF